MDKKEVKDISNTINENAIKIEECRKIIALLKTIQIKTPTKRQKNKK